MHRFPPSCTRHPGSVGIGRSVIAILGLLLTCVSAPDSRAATILPSGLLKVDGKAFFPIGLVSNGYKRYPDDWHRMIRESRANLVWDIEIAYADTAIGCEAFVDSAAAAGYKLLIGSGDTWHWDVVGTPELEVDQLMYESEDIPALLECRDHVPGTVIAWANRDEPVWTISRNRIGDIDSTHVMWTYDQLKSIDPNGLVAMNFAPAHLSEDYEIWKSDLSGYLPATDIVMFASYPYPAGPGTCGSRNVLGYPECKMDRLPISCDIFLNEINRPGQPLWMIIQAFKDVPYKEAKWEAVASVVHGATGILWGGWTWWHALGHGIDMWPVTTRVMGEMAHVQKILAGYDLPGAETDEPDVDVRAMKGAGHHVAVFAISRNGYSGTAEIKLPGINSGNVTVLHEVRTLPVVNGWISDEFDGYEAHVYSYQLNYTGAPTSAPAPAVTPAAFQVRTYPNPSRGRTVTEFHLPNDASAVFTVYDTAGRRVALAGSGRYEAGTGTVVWNGRDYQGHPVAPGVYFIRGRTSDGESATARILIHR